ncbi:hypothetical protein D6779_00865 [Candidatus Parcubacteria bacterium]|nr:MAG: hypothetical protein D6779_00865 [Candidatus Parcubacteria bacterium]
MATVKIVNLEQGTPEWLKWRKERITATDAPVIMGASPWEKPLDLWHRKRGELSPVAENPAMRRGKQLEPHARNLWMQQTGLFANPACVEHPDHPWAGASLDGLAIDGSFILEIKCPGEGTHEGIKQGDVPYHYYLQVQHQLWCTPGAEKAYFVSYRPEDEEEPLASVIIYSDEEVIEKMMHKEKAFWLSLQAGEPPVAIEWEALEQELYELEQQKKQLEERISNVRSAMQEVIPEGETSYEGFLYTAKLVSRKGSVDTNKAFKTLVDLVGEDEVYQLTGKKPDEFLENFRRPDAKPSWTFRARKVDEAVKQERLMVVKQAAMKGEDADAVKALATGF